ncbi:hypothetical protein NUW58_g1482 [Xylaria curta]|uniref:Uncharacterized protein n=1 Tax=Xylaria curta TaxID=42375 RepID=A0ACC1PMR6_9PEZI|nr:hypothetical protein NUW58_g1482 [Xylaria curta]
MENWRAPPSFEVAFWRHISPILGKRGYREKRVPQALSVGDWFILNYHLQFSQKSVGDWVKSMDGNVLGEEGDFENDSGYRFERRFKSTVGGRRLFTTKRGYLGLADKSVQRGDRLYVFMGGRMPIILRTIKDGLRFICECYTHGIMFGEAVEDKCLQGPTAQLTIYNTPSRHIRIVKRRFSPARRPYLTS